MHDCWTCSGIHLVGLFGLYNRSVKSQFKVVGPLLSVSPMTKLGDCDSATTCSCVSETNDSDFQTLASRIRSMLEFYEVDISEWAVCQTADNCNGNKALARNLCIPHVGCMSHKLNLEVELMVPTDAELKQCI